MGVSSIDEVVATSPTTRFGTVWRLQEEHEKLKDQIQVQLDKFHDEGKEPEPMAKSMSWVKTNAKARNGRVGQHHRRPYHRRLQHGRQVA